MTQVLTVRIPHELLSKAEARAARLGLDRAKYVRGLIEQDLSKETRQPKHKFGSEDLIGSVALGEGPYPNRCVRELMRARGIAKRANRWR